MGQKSTEIKSTRKKWERGRGGGGAGGGRKCLSPAMHKVITLKRDGGRKECNRGGEAAGKGGRGNKGRGGEKCFTTSYVYSYCAEEEMEKGIKEKEEEVKEEDDSEYDYD